MANNIIGGKRNVVFGKKNIAIADTPMNSSNVLVILRYGENVTSHNPSKGLNNFNDIEIDMGYVVSAKTSMDLTDIFNTPPFTAGGGILAEDGNPIIPES